MTDLELQRAAARNHLQKFRRDCAGCGPFVQTDEIAYGFAGPDEESMSGFPLLSPERAGPVLDEMVRFYAERRPKKAVGFWSLDPTSPIDLDARLLARGFRPGWQPCWMALSLAEFSPAHCPAPSGVTVLEDDGPYSAPTPGLPYDCTASPGDEHFHRIVAVEDGAVLGHACVLLPDDGATGAGLYNVGTVPAARGRGIGRAVVAAACELARARGCTHATLNATGRTMYEAVGFRHIGDGRTWWLDASAVADDPVEPGRIVLCEAIARGDLTELDRLTPTVPDDWLTRPLPNHFSPIQLAVNTGQPDSVRWLIAHGAPLDPLSAWELGWKDDAARLLRESPDAVNQRYGEFSATLLHLASMRGDIALAELALSANPDLTICDSNWNGTPRGWAHAIGRPQIAALIDEYVARREQAVGSRQ